MARPVHEVGRILAVVDGELRIEAEPRRIFAQEAARRGVERSRIGRRRGGGRLRRETAGEQALDPAAKLGRRAAREGGEHDALRIGAGEDERRHPMRQHRRLARARAGDDEQRPGPFGSPIPCSTASRCSGLRSTAGLERIRASDMGRRNHVSRFVRKGGDAGSGSVRRGALEGKVIPPYHKSRERAKSVIDFARIPP